MEIPIPANVGGSKRSLHRSHLDYVTRNWPVWWNLRLGLPLAFAVAIAAMTTVYALGMDMSGWEAANSAEMVQLRERLFSEGVKPNNSGNYWSWDVERLKGSDRALMSKWNVNLGYIQAVGYALQVLPIVVSLLFACAWYFLVARSFKFPYAPRLGYQPRYWVLAMIGLVLLWSGLIGFKIFETRAFGVALYDWSHNGGILGSIASDAPIGYTGNEFVTGIFFSSAFIGVAAVFTMLQRKLSLVAAFGSFVVILLGLAVLLLLQVLWSWLSAHLEQYYVIAWAVLIFASAAVATARRNIRGISAVAIGIIAYLLSIGPVAFVVLNLNKFFPLGDATQRFLMYSAGGYLVIIVISVMACEGLFTVVNRLLIRPA